MQASGLEAIFQLIYADNIVQSMLDGKQISRALRAHILLYGALHDLIISKVGVSKDEALVKLSADLYKEHPTSINSSAVINTLTEKIRSFWDYERDSKTAKLWLQYLDMVSICLLFLKAERTGDWELHLSMCREMLPYFASSGHYHYLTSAHLYLQEMSKLKETHHRVYNEFCKGNHVVRRSDRFWAGLSTDLVIEQVLMRTLKTSGGLTRGRGITERQRAIWLLSMPVTSEVTGAMQDFTDVTFYTSEQHKDSSNSIIARDHSDGNKISEYLKERDPFEIDRRLINISTREVADEGVNVYYARSLGEKLVKTMEGQGVFTFVYKKANKAKQMQSKNAVLIDGEKVSIDSTLLFQRLIAVYSLEELSTAFQYELSSQPMSLFDKDGLMNEADKPKLKAAIKELTNEVERETPLSMHFVLDGGSLLHKVQWSVGQTFEEICKNYWSYISKRYGHNKMVVFDGGYLQPSTTIHQGYKTHQKMQGKKRERC